MKNPIKKVLSRTSDRDVGSGGGEEGSRFRRALSSVKSAKTEGHPREEEGQARSSWSRSDGARSSSDSTASTSTLDSCSRSSSISTASTASTSSSAAAAVRSRDPAASSEERSKCSDISKSTSSSLSAQQQQLGPGRTQSTRPEMFVDAQDSLVGEATADRVPDLGQPDGIDVPATPAAGATARKGGTPLGMDLTPEDRHYLNKALVHLEMAQEWSALSQPGQLSRLGEPYLPHPNGPRSKPGSEAKNPISVDKAILPASPLMNYLSWRFIYHFPGFHTAPPEHWYRVQAFFDSMAERNLSSTPERGEVTKRRIMAFAFNRLFSTFTAVGLPANGPSSPASLDADMVSAIDDLYADSDERRRTTWVNAGKKVDEYRRNWKTWVHELYMEDGLDRTFELVHDKTSVQELPERYRKLIEWASLWIAHLIYTVFVSSDNAKEHLHLFSRIHNMIPYGMAKQALRMANPTFIAKTLVSIIFSEPFRQKSLFTRIATAIINGDMKSKQEKIDQLVQHVDPAVVTALKRHVYATSADQACARQMSFKFKEDIVISILRHAAIDAELLQAHIQYKEAYKQALLSNKPEEMGDAAGDAGKYAALKMLLKALSEKRDREEILQVVVEPNTPEMIKSTISVFYNGISGVAKATRLVNHITDLQNFMGDVVKTASQPECSRADMIQMVRRHASSVYRFIHAIHSNDKDVMGGFIEWDRTAFNFMKEGVPRNSDERLGMDDHILSGVSAEQKTKILEEVRELALWTKMHKALEDIRRRIDVAQLEDPDFTACPDELLERFVHSNKAFRDLQDRQLSANVIRPEQSVEWMWYSSPPSANSLSGPSDTATSAAAKPPIDLHHVRCLLPAYVEHIQRPLANARQRNLK